MHTGGLEKRLVLDNLSVYTPSLEEEEKKEKKELNLQQVFLVPALAEVPGERWCFWVPDFAEGALSPSHTVYMKLESC